MWREQLYVMNVRLRRLSRDKLLGSYRIFGATQSPVSHHASYMSGFLKYRSSRHYCRL